MDANKERAEGGVGWPLTVFFFFFKSLFIYIYFREKENARERVGRKQREGDKQPPR